MINIQKILFATDMSPTAGNAFTHAALLARRFGAVLHVLHVAKSRSRFKPANLLPPPTGTGLEADDEQFRAGLIRSISTEPAVSTGIIRYAELHEVDLIVMGSGGNGAGKSPRLGSVVTDVIRRAPCPVLTARWPVSGLGYRRILVPVDFSRNSSQAVSIAKDLAASLHARVHMLHVLRPDSDVRLADVVQSGDRASLAQRGLESRMTRFAVDAYGPAVPTHTKIARGAPAQSIVDYSARLQAGMVIMAPHGKSAVLRMMAGGVSERVAGATYSPVLTLRREGRPIQITAPIQVPCHMQYGMDPLV
jgi:nucleotide-binding universal stress UspA family protein